MSCVPSWLDLRLGLSLISTYYCYLVSWGALKEGRRSCI